MGVFGFEFTIIGRGDIQDTQAAKALISQFLLPEAQIAVHSMVYDYLSSHDQSSLRPLSCEIKGKIWMRV